MLKWRNLPQLIFYLSSLLLLACSSSVGGLESDLFAIWQTDNCLKEVEFTRDGSARFAYWVSGNVLNGRSELTTDWTVPSKGQIQTTLATYQYSISGDRLTLTSSEDTVVYGRSDGSIDCGDSRDLDWDPATGKIVGRIDDDTTTPSTTTNSQPRQFEIERVSVSSDGEAGDSSSGQPQISANGRYVTFLTTANNFGLPHWEWWLHDRKTGDTLPIKIDAQQVPFVSNEGNLFVSPVGRQRTTGEQVIDPATGSLTIVNQDWSSAIERNADLNYAILPGRDGKTSVHSLRNLLRETENSPPTDVRKEVLRLLPNVTSDGSQVAVIVETPTSTSRPSHAIIYDSNQMSVIPGGVPEGEDKYSTAYPMSLSPDGKYLLFGARLVVGSGPSTEYVPNLYIRDLQNLKSEMVNISVDGTGRTDAFQGTMSDDGRFIAFSGADPDNRNAHILIHDRKNGETRSVSVGLDQALGNGPSRYPVISPDGKHIAFDSEASNLVPNDTNGEQDVFVAENPFLFGG